MSNTNTLKHYLQLLEVFTLREIKSRYKASLLGPLWIILYPLLTAFILNFVFGTFINIKTEGVPYFIFVLSGLVVWNFFQQGVELAKNALIWNRDLITKTSFPISTLPVALVISKIPDFIVYLILLVIFYTFNGYQANLFWLIIIIVILPLFLLTTGVALLSSLSNAVFRDFGKIIEFAFMILFYATPIIYPESLIPDRYKFILYLNPLALFITFIRELIFNADLRPELFLYSLPISILTFLAGIYLFKRYHKKISDLI
ncbi:hypothetical protein A2767_07645 [Candidatus Roizmanbacteria bacterium RIFCSPHIGHO2_01_FULL_35_10]|uniref:Transport permease protein n=1 Tax=Candidatus Roizmanbacteria bacterium RIFCSPLOWO2_01_FULL_35_13 TaxID=1802055 RepID=A0A1F7ICR2_9BACT|nr:MAG: hypothetical protein A2767_07645 [Candidatus Roizmanbacteria bacterium RIFCSPHIGHO2_01_FULL_35_10]OGK41141.1 MAG: hypothetical protein A3A74_02245 [Candidatus Roizmanbacteria bacterium RIFCSPLOWO2_01_FULL_35_13]